MKKALLLAPMSSVHERFNIANISALSELDYEIHLAANFSVDEHAKEYKKKCEKEGFIVYDIPFFRHSLLNNIKYVKSIKKLLAKEDYDIVHAHTETGGILLRLSLNSDKSTKYIYTAHGMSFYKGSSIKSQLIYRPIERFICQKMDCNVAINQEEFDILSRWNIHTSYFVHGAGFNLDEISNAVVDKNIKKAELGIPTDKKLILSVGELNENKNHSIILKAISNMPYEERPYLLICGEGNKRNELLRLAKSFNYEDSLFLPGYRYDMPEIFNIADIFVFPSFHEGLSFALMQAMAAKLPIVCTEIRGNTDLMDADQGGYFCSPNDELSIKNAIVDLIKDESKRQLFGEHNHTKVLLYDCENVKKELMNIYSIA